MSSMTYTLTHRTLVSLGLCAGLVAACGDSGSDDETTTTMSGPTSITLTPGMTESNPTEATATMSTLTNDPTGMTKLDLPPDDTEVLPDCSADGTCNLLDILFVIDNSGSMGEEQTNLANNFGFLIDKIRNLTDKKGELVNADVNIMVTTTDFGHPLCAPFNKPDYTPAKGAPINTACTDRLERFNGFDGKSFPEACTNHCTPGSAAVPMGPFIHFNPDSSNVVDPDGMGDAVADALSCIGPQGVDGCGMEATLETMLQALDPSKDWNKGGSPFLRTGAVLAIVIVTDEEDCAAKDYAYFDPQNKDDPNFNQYWETNPDTMAKDQPTSAVCWNAGTECTDANADTVYESCVSADKGVLQPLDRYKDYLQKVLIDQKNKQVVMLGILGVPPVTARNPDPPFQPTDGGVFDLVYRDWTPADILMGDPKTAAQKQYDFGIGPGCSNPATGQAIPPVRVKEVCESLNVVDDPNTTADETKLRCCIESICSEDFSPAINCLAGILQNELQAPG
jgi:hypothetical protein